MSRIVLVALIAGAFAPAAAQPPREPARIVAAFKTDLVKSNRFAQSSLETKWGRHALVAWKAGKGPTTKAARDAEFMRLVFAGAVSARDEAAARAGFDWLVDWSGSRRGAGKFEARLRRQLGKLGR